MDIASYLLGKNSSGGGGGEIPTKGVVFNEWDENGHPTNIDVYGFTATNISYFATTNATSSNTGGVTSRVKTVNFHDGSNMVSLGENTFYYMVNLESVNGLTNSQITIIPASCFQNCVKLTTFPFSTSNGITGIQQNAFNLCNKMSLTELPSSLTTIGASAFYGCNGIAISRLPDNLTSLGTNCFDSCTSIKTMDLNNFSGVVPSNCFASNSLVSVYAPNVTGAYGAGTANGAFRSCRYLVAIWFGSNITSSNMGRYVFNQDTRLQKIYIDLPRATTHLDIHMLLTERYITMVI